MEYVNIFILAVVFAAFWLGYALGNHEKEMTNEEEDFTDWVRRVNKPIDFELSDTDGRFSVPPFLRPYIPDESEDRCSGKCCGDCCNTDC